MKTRGYVQASWKWWAFSPPLTQRHTSKDQRNPRGRQEQEGPVYLRPWSGGMDCSGEFWQGAWWCFWGMRRWRHLQAGQRCRLKWELVKQNKPTNLNPRFSLCLFLPPHLNALRDLEKSLCPKWGAAILGSSTPSPITPGQCGGGGDSCTQG